MRISDLIAAPEAIKAEHGELTCVDQRVWAASIEADLRIFVRYVLGQNGPRCCNWAYGSYASCAATTVRVIVVKLNPSRAVGLTPSLVGHDFASAEGLESAFALLRDGKPDVIVLDIGSELAPGAAPTPAQAYQWLADAAYGTPIIAVGAADEIVAHQLLNLGGFDFLIYPDEIDSLAHAIKRASRAAQLERRPSNIGGRHRLSEVIPGLLTGDPAMRRVARRCERLAGHRTRVLLQGEAGTGRKTLARMLSQSRRDAAPTSAAPAGELSGDHWLLPPLLLCSASTRISDINDFFEKANMTARLIIGASGLGSLVILESIDDLSPDTQAALLHRLIVADTVWRDHTALPRTISIATERLGGRIAEGMFRRDLYDRLAEVHLRLPPLRNRNNDSVELADWFLQKFQQSLGRRRLRLSDEAIDAIRAHEWPGNVAELSNATRQAVITAEGPSVFAADLGLSHTHTTPLGSLRQAREDAERDIVQRALKKANGNIARASEMLGLRRPTLYDLLKKLGMR